MGEKQDLKSLPRKELIKWFEQHNFTGFRAKQVFNWLFKNGVDHFAEMTNLPAGLRDKIAEKAFISRLSCQESSKAKDGTIKYLWLLSDHELIESVYLPGEQGRNTVCISSQVGCMLNCRFCATGSGGFVRNLTSGEIVDQVLKMQAGISPEGFGEPRISNVVLMGMGEPLANLDHVLAAVEIINDRAGLNIGMRKITISTSGLVPGIRTLAERDLQLVLAISLNAPNNQLRSYLMPINQKYPLEELLAASRYYIKKTGRRITFEYVLIKDVNESVQLARATASLLQGILCNVNLIPLNSVNDFKLKKPDRKKINRFKEILEEQGIETTIRQERGSKIEAACGQLRRLKQ